MASQIVTSGANFATTLILVRSIGLEAFGQFSICFLLTMLSRNFLTATVLTPMSTIGPRLKPAAMPAYRGFLAVNAVVFALGSSALLVIAATPLSIVLGAPWLAGIALATAAANVTGSLADFMRRYHFVYEAPRHAFLVDLARYTAQIAGLLLLPTLTGTLLTPETALFALAFAGLTGICAGAAAFGVMRHHPRLWSTIWPRHWNFIKWMTPAESLEAVQANLPFFVAGAMLGEAQLGTIRAVQSIANVANLPGNAAQSIVPALASRAYGLDGRHAMTRAVRSVLTWSSALCLVAGGIVIIAAGPIFRKLFGMELALPDMMGLLLFLALNLVLLVRLMSITTLQTLQRPAAVLATNLLGAALSIALAPMLVLAMGAPGIPATFLVAAIAIALLGIRLGRPVRAGAGG